MTPGLRKLALTAHVTVSVEWLESVAGFLALAVAGSWLLAASYALAVY